MKKLLRNRRGNSHQARRWRLALSLLLLLPLVTGCWDRIEMEKRATILGLSIDVPSQAHLDQSAEVQGEASKTVLHTPELYEKLESKNKIELTAQIAVPGRIPLGPGSGGGNGNQPQMAVWVVHAFGVSLGDALKELQQHLAERIFLGHLRLITISDEVAREQGVYTFLDYLRRNPEIRRTAWLTVCKGRADKLMETAPPLERVPTLYLLATMQSAIHLGKLPSDFLGTVESKETMWGREPVLPYLAVAENQVEILGIAAFAHGKMTYSLSPADETIYQQLDGGYNAATSIIVPIDQTSDFVVWHSFARDRRIRVKIVNGVPHVDIFLHVDGNIDEKSKESIDIHSQLLLQQVEKRMKRFAEQHMMSVLKTTQEHKSDIVGIGEYVRAKQPAYWREHVHSPEDWTNIYPKVTFTVRAVFQTHRSGMSL